jgi:GntR family transcriptional regulator
MNSAARTGEPVHMRIETELRTEITGGRLNPGEMLLSESRLMARFSASRETVRKSLKGLEHEGLIYARPGKGYFVANPEHNLYSFFFSDDDEGEGYESKFVKINYELPTADVRAALTLPEKERVLRISRVIMLHNDPVAYDEKYIPYDKGTPIIEAEIKYAVFPQIVSAKAPPFAFYTKMEIGSGNADAKLQKLLNCKAGESLLVLYRQIIGNNNARLGYGKKYLTSRWGRLKAISGYRDGRPG